MRFTRAGKDYHAAILLLAGMGLGTGGVLFAALALALAFASLLSLVLAMNRFPKSVSVRVASSPVRVLKGEEGRMALSIPGLRDPWATVKVESLRVSGPVKTSALSVGSEEAEFSVRPLVAGRFAEMEAVLRLGDVLGLFHTTRSVPLSGATVDSLPLSLVAPVRRALVPPLAVGDSQADRAGKGQEFYGIEEYTQHSESRDIMWNRAAKYPDRPLLARVREANTPESVTIEVIHGTISKDRRPDLVDLQCEALGTLGRALLLARIRADIVAPDGTVSEAVDDRELADAIMESSTSLGSAAKTEGEGARILLLVGDWQGEAPAGSRVPSVLIGWEGPPVLDRYAVPFSGTEDLSGLLSLVLA